MMGFEEELEWEDEEQEYEEPLTPDNCPMGSYQPGTEQCDFCPWSEECAEWFYENMVKNK